MSQEKSIKVAAIQMCAELADVNENLLKTEYLVRHAAKEGAGWVVLPEFFTSACAFHPKMLEAILPIEGEATQLLKQLSKELNIIIGGSFLAKHQKDIFNTFILVFPNGDIFAHDKDIPTMWENCYYMGGNDDGVLKTKTYNIGVALCWEMLRSQTARRLNGKVDFVVGGSCWWDLPNSAPKKFNFLREKSLALLNSAPSTFAKLLGVPVIHAGHAGEFQAYAAPSNEKPYESHYLGETMIVDGYGRVLAHLAREEGESVIVAEINLGHRVVPSMDISDEYWIHDMPKAFISEWEKLNPFGQTYYQDYIRKRNVST